MLNNVSNIPIKQPSVLRYPSPREANIWLQRRQGTPPSAIADRLEVGRPYISKVLRKTEKRILELLEHAAYINAIQVHHISGVQGIAVGYCPAYKSETIISYTPELGIQVWFEHRGDCSGCTEYGRCIHLISALSSDWNIPIARNAVSVEAANDLFDSILKKLGWRE
jgi:hypothetical protein